MRSGPFLLSSWLVLAACIPLPPTDAPAAVLAKTPPVVTKPGEGTSHGRRVTIREARARAVTGEDPWVRRIVHPGNLGKLRAPALVIAEVDAPFDGGATTASPVIVVDGAPLGNSIVVRNGEDRVYAVAPSAPPGSVMKVQVGWLGALEETLGPAVEVTVAGRD